MVGITGKALPLPKRGERVAGLEYVATGLDATVYRGGDKALHVYHSLGHEGVEQYVRMMARARNFLEGERIPFLKNAVRVAVPPVLDYGVGPFSQGVWSGEHAYTVMPFVEGPTIADFLLTRLELELDPLDEETTNALVAIENKLEQAGVPGTHLMWCNVKLAYRGNEMVFVVTDLADDVGRLVREPVHTMPVKAAVATPAYTTKQTGLVRLVSHRVA